MLLYLMRHGPAVNREDPDCPPDAERPLTREGAQRTRQAALGLRRLGVKPQVILSSPLLRALQTAEAVAEVLGLPKEKIRRTAVLEPEADPAEFLKEIARLTSDETLCAGHAPNLDELIAHAVGARVPFTSLKKAGVACLGFEPGASARGSLLWLYPPKVLRFLGE